MDIGKIIMIVLGAGPIALLLVGALIGGAVYIASQIKWDPAVPWLIMGALSIPLLLIGLLCVTCYRVMPREAFQDLHADSSGGADTALLTDLAAAEDAVCRLITRVDGFIQNDVGPAGVSDSQLILAAQMKAREGVAMVDCSATEAAMEDVPHRLTWLEETLRSFTGPELQRTYDTTMRCEGFVGDPQDPRTRLTAIQATLRTQQVRLLAPLDQKTEDLKKGIASDCDKKKAAAKAQTLPGGGGAA